MALMISYSDIENKVVEILSVGGKYDRDLIRKSLNKYIDGNRKNFVIFMNKISSTPEETLNEMYKHVVEKHADFIVDVEKQNNSLSFNINKKSLCKDIVTAVLKKKEQFGSNETGNGHTMVLDYSSPNIAKIFHVGHFRTTILGNFIKNILVFNGYKTVSINYLGDWGKQFGLVLLGYEMFGSEEKLKEDSLMHLFHVYVEVNKHKELQQKARDIFKEMEEGTNQKYLDQWKMFRDMSIVKYKKLYKKLNIEFDVYSGESLYNERAKEYANKCSFATKDSDKSIFVDLGPEGVTLLLKNDGTTLYITRDIVAIQERMAQYKPKEIIYVVSSEQDQHFKQLFKMAEMDGYDQSHFRHVNFGLVKGMSTREGTVHFIDDVIDTAYEVFYDFVKDKENVLNKKDTALQLAISFLLVNDFGAKRIKGYTFDIKKQATTQKGQALGPTIQYTHCRLVSIGEKNSNMAAPVESIDFSKIQDQELCNLAYKLLWFEKINEMTLLDYEPSRIVLYLKDLCNTINSAINNFIVKDEEKSVAAARLALFKAAQVVLGNGIRILGLLPLNKM
ncbi:Arginyl-tRNA synthetase [Enterospora canceri]|uniref:arginine--tRNA ligase n=1 Tax=Enterospora canceri TaxID=1081671 RepID=A0A1Y1S9H8_9MICR|nr:Arginyl-tRNA synthetase [Enterospora canceri]